MNETLKTTPLTAIHQELGAKMVSFAGYLMPIQYSGIREEHLAVRNNVGVFDVSHMGEFIVKGQGALDFLQQVTTNDVARLQIGQAQYSAMPNDRGGIVDDLLVYRLPEDRCAEGERAYMLVVNASNMAKDYTWLERHLSDHEVTLTDISDKTGLLAVQGPNAARVLQPLTEVDLSGMKYYTFDKGTFAGVDNVLLSATGYTGAGGFEIYADADKMPTIWEAIFEAGADHGILPVGLGARDTLRLEMGYALYGNDIDDDTSPIEAGLGWITKLKKGAFNSSEIFSKQRDEGARRRLVGFEMLDRRVPRKGYTLHDGEGRQIGVVTSGTQSPSLDKPIGMGYVEREHASPGTEIYVGVRNKQLKAQVVKPPFFKG